MNRQEILEKALTEWGIVQQLDMLVEECAELIVAIEHWQRGRVGLDKLVEEGVDVKLMIEQLQFITGKPILWKHIEEEKLTRLEKILLGESNDRR